MFLPIGDTPNPPGRAYVTHALIAINIGIFVFLSFPMTLAQPNLNDPVLFEYLRIIGVRGPIPVPLILEHVTAYDLFVYKYGFRPADPSVTTLFASMFLHAGWLHLAGNMLFMWIFGDNVEHRLGRLRYLLVYLACGVVATVFFALFVPGSQVPLVGASGAISGVLGCYYLWFPRNKVKAFIFLFPFIMSTFLIPARLVLGFYLLVDNLLPFLINGGGGAGVAHGAHIGGFMAGLGMAFGVERFFEQKRVGVRLSPACEEEVPSGSAGGRTSWWSADDVMQSLQKGMPGRAVSQYFSLDSRNERGRVRGQSVLAMGDYLLAQREYGQAAYLFRRFIAERPSDPAIDRAYLGAGKALVYQPRCVTSAYQYFLAAVDATQDPVVANEARGYLRAIERLEVKS